MCLSRYEIKGLIYEKRDINFEDLLVEEQLKQMLEISANSKHEILLSQYEIKGLIYETRHSFWKFLGTRATKEDVGNPGKDANFVYLSVNHKD